MTEKEIIDRITKKLRELHDGSTPWSVRSRLMEFITELENYAQKLAATPTPANDTRRTTDATLSTKES